MQCNAIKCDAMRCNATRCNAMQCDAMVCYAMCCDDTFSGRVGLTPKDHAILNLFPHHTPDDAIEYVATHGSMLQLPGNRNELF